MGTKAQTNYEREARAFWIKAGLAAAVLLGGYGAIMHWGIGEDTVLVGGGDETSETAQAVVETSATTPSLHASDVYIQFLRDTDPNLAEVSPEELLALGEQVCYQVKDEGLTGQEMVGVLDTLGTGQSTQSNANLVVGAQNYLC